jgi:hypothetical protein
MSNEIKPITVDINRNGTFWVESSFERMVKVDPDNIESATQPSSIECIPFANRNMEVENHKTADKTYVITLFPEHIKNIQIEE